MIPVSELALSESILSWQGCIPSNPTAHTVWLQVLLGIHVCIGGALHTSGLDLKRDAVYYSGRYLPDNDMNA